MLVSFQALITQKNIRIVFFATLGAEVLDVALCMFFAREIDRLARPTNVNYSLK